MPPTNRTRYVILGLLSDGPKSGYDIKKEIEGVTTHFWRESFGQIYPALSALCDDGLARKEVAGAVNGRRRVTYAITRLGRSELKRWLAIEPGPGIIRHELLLKIFFGKHTDPETLIGHVEAYRERVAGMREFLKQAEREVRSDVAAEDRAYWMLPVRSGQLVVEAGLTWADEALTTLRRMVRRGAALLAFATTFALAPAAAQSVPAKLDEYVTAAASLGRFSGAVLVAQRGTILLRKGYGMADLEWNLPNTPETKFRIASVTKTFTGAAIMLLQERGRLSVRDPICNFVADCPAAWRDITIHHVLTHTSGIPNYMGFPDYAATMGVATNVPTLIARFRDKPLDFAPGTQYRYSNSGYILLGQVIERASGQGYAIFLRANLLGPAGLANTGYDIPFRVLPQRAAGYSRASDAVINAPYIAMSVTHSAGALFSTVDDLYNWDRAIASDRLLTRASREAMWTPVKNDYGYGWGLDTAMGRRRVGHNGQVNGFTSILSSFPNDSVTIVVLTNSDQTVPGVNRVARDLAAIVFGAPYELPKRLIAATVDARVLDAYVGEYELQPDQIVTIARTATGLSGQITGSAPFEMRAESEVRFAVDVVDAVITFERNASGAATHLVVTQGRTNERARKIR